MNGPTAVTIILVVLILAAALCYIAWLLVSRMGIGNNGSPAGNTLWLVPGRATQEGGVEPFFYSPPQEPHDHTHDHDEAIRQALDEHFTNDHGDHDHEELATSQQLRDLQRQVNNQQQEVARLHRRFNRLRLRTASQFPWELIGALTGTVVGIIVAFTISAKHYSYATHTNVYVNGTIAKIQNRLTEFHWVQLGIIAFGLLVGLVLGFAAKYLFGRTVVAVEEIPQ